MGHPGMSPSHIVHLKIAYMVVPSLLHITHTGDGKIIGTTATQHHFDHHTQTMISKSFTTGGLPGKVIGFITAAYISISTMSFTHIAIVKISDNCHKMVGPQLLREIH